MVKTITLKEIKLGMCLAEAATTKAGVEIFKSKFYFTSRNQIKNLMDNGITEVKIDLATSLVDLKNSMENEKNIYAVKKELENPIEKFEKMREHIQETKEVFDQGDKIVTELMDSARSGKALNKKAVREEAVKIIENIQNDPLLALVLLDLKNYDEYSFIHSVNVAIMSVAFAYNVKFSQEKLLAIGQGSILHDIGKAKLPIDVLNKPGKLTDEEFQIIKQHPDFGLEVIEKDNITNEIVKEIILHHHEDYDGSGYPAKIGGSDMKRFASIVAVADFYDALTTKRVYKEPIAPPDAIKMIFNLSGTKFDPRIVNHFVKTIGIYPIGSIVELSDKRLATVIAFSKNNLLQPVVKTIPAHKKQQSEIISLVHSHLYIIGVASDVNLKTADFFQ